MNQTYRFSKSLKTMNVDKEILRDIENYCFNKLPDFLKLSKADIQRNYATNIKEINGEENFDIIDNYEFKQFPDDTKKISIGFFHRDSKIDVEYSVYLYFSLNRYESKVDITIKADNAREKALGIAEQLDRILLQKKNFNYIFHLPMVPTIILVLIGWLTPSIALFLKDINIKISVASIFLGFIIASYFWLFKMWKPYCSFNTNQQDKNDKIANYFGLGLITFVIFSSLLVFLRKWLLGF